MTYQHLSASQVHQMRQRGDDIVLIDVREQYEHDVAHIEGAHLCPMSKAAKLPPLVVVRKFCAINGYPMAG